MKDKEKGKLNPFAGHLRPTEEVLWMSAQAEMSPWNQVTSNAAFLGGGVSFLLLVVMRIGGGAQGLQIFGLAMGILVLIGGPVLLVMGLYAGAKRLFNGPNLPKRERIYVVTNERLLYRHKNNVSSIALEALPSISLFLGEGTSGTFNFGALFPMWPDVEDAIMVKHLIDDAQKQRLQKTAA